MTDIDGDYAQGSVHVHVHVEGDVNVNAK
jgi:hypothetical protein